MAKVQLKQVERKGKIALVLAYTLDGKRRQESTGLSLLLSKDKESKEVNKKVLIEANKLVLQKEIELANDKVTVKSPKLLDYFDKTLKAKKVQQRYAYNTVLKWQNARLHLLEYLTSIGKPAILLNQLTATVLKGFVEHIKASNLKNGKPSSNTTCNIITSKLALVLKEAMAEGLVDTKVGMYRMRMKEDKPVIQYLTAEQLEQLANTPCREPYLKEAFLFACNTGLRLSDICNLEWSQISKEESVMRLTTQKTKTAMEQPLNAKAMAILNSIFSINEKVFGTLARRRPSLRQYLIEWFKNAGIDKEIRPHFHLSRDTFANLLIAKGVDLKTVSVLLSHASVITTEQHYIGKLSNTTKRSALDVL